MKTVIEMAREAGMAVIDDQYSLLPFLERLVELARADERERLHDKFMEIHKSQQHSNNYWHFAARKIKEQE